MLTKFAAFTKNIELMVADARAWHRSLDLGDDPPKLAGSDILLAGQCRRRRGSLLPQILRG
jgi:hypothetical protein